MQRKPKSRIPYQRIVVGLPDIQNQLRVVDRLVSQVVDDRDRNQLENLGGLLSEFYLQLQHQKQLTIYRFGSKTRSKVDVD